MKATYWIFRVVLGFLPALVMVGGLFGTTFAHAEGIWSSAGVVPSTDGETPTEAISPDERRKVVAARDGLHLVTVKNQDSVVIPVIAIQPLWEVVWAPDSTSLAVNASDGGAVGTWDATIFRVDSAGRILTFAVSDLVRKVARTFAKCLSAEDVNVALVGWEKQGDIARVVVEVPPHSSCRNMGQLRGYRISVRSKEILERVSERAVRARWTAQLGLRFGP